MPKSFIANESRYSEALELISDEEVKERALKNLDNDYKINGYELDRKGRPIMSKILSGAFTWYGTPEGDSYWRELAEKFNAEHPKI